MYLPPLPSHPVVGIWHDEVIPATLQLVTEMSIEMTCLYLLQRKSPSEVEVGIEAFETRSLIWIGVEPESTTVPQAKRLVERCVAMLDGFGLNSLFVEVHNGSVVSHALPQFLPDRPLSRTRQYETPFQLCSGWSIAPASQRSTRGTGGVFVNLDGQEGQYLVSCQHVITPNNGLERRFDPSSAGETVNIMSRGVFYDQMDGMTKAQADIGVEIDDLTGTILRNPENEEDVIETESDITKLRDKRAKLAILQETIDETWSDIGDRSIGNICCHPSIASTSGWTLAGFNPNAKVGFDCDWSLIKLVDGLIPQDCSPNILRIPTTISRAARSVFGTIKDLSVSMTEVVPMSALMGHNTPCIKVGAATHCTVGIASAVLAVERPKEGSDSFGNRVEKGVWSLVLPIHGLEDQDFSSKGDSGSAVVNSEGGVMGMITSGHRLLKISHALPMEILMKDIERYTGFTPRLVNGQTQI